MKLLTTSIGVLLAVALLAAGCGSGEEAQSAGDVPSGDTTTEPAPGDVKDYRVWLTRGEHLFAVTREDRAVPELPFGETMVAVQQLLEGPTAAEAAAGVGTAIPAGTRFLEARMGAAGAVTVNLTSEYESGGGSASMFARLAQVVYTLTEFPTVQRVSFELDGKPVDVFSGEGIVLDKPVTRADYEDVLPPILVESPPIGAEVSSPIEVAGTANVFEANVTGRVLDENGKELVSRFTTATCGTGCRGRFAMELPYQVAVDQPGTLVLQDDDADGDGNPSFEVRIPVTLSG
jgi:germination protein M